MTEFYRIRTLQTAIEMNSTSTQENVFSRGRGREQNGRNKRCSADR